MRFIIIFEDDMGALDVADMVQWRTNDGVGKGERVVKNIQGRIDDGPCKIMSVPITAEDKILMSNGHVDVEVELLGRLWAKWLNNVKIVEFSCETSSGLKVTETVNINGEDGRLRGVVEGSSQQSFLFGPGASDVVEHGSFWWFVMCWQLVAVEKEGRLEVVRLVKIVGFAVGLAGDVNG